ncbi:hypothetical protein [Paenibacillus sp. PL91]|uniref:hypothetical protein n=1 Tax=Paenibacillus sp. PL91 TaxID=2729538 RepID=UPI00145E17A2|nr:hypothetical protein [Paenibacillus sp. PL91]MBC9200259.1 hypothetical protein [Paenibacillus sp. PL91]
MDKQQMIDLILEEYGLAKNALRAQLDAILLRLFAHKGELTAEVLLEWNEKDLMLLYKTASGVKLTREHVPNIIDEYAKMAPGQLSSTVSFGQIQHEEEIDLVPRIHRQYGKYELPPTIQRLYELEEELGSEMDLEIGLRMQKYDMRYPCTPPDFIPFASPGVDGIHYCFVTDFGTITDLENAYIAVVSPMDFGSETWLIASNIKDFLRILCTDKSILYNSIAAFDVSKAGQTGGEELTPALQRLKEIFNLAIIPDLAEYIESLRKQREQLIRIQTLDSIGIVPLAGRTNQTAAQPLSINWNDEQEMRAMLKAASPETKLAFIRDAQHENRIYDDKGMLRRCKSILSELELYHELQNLLECAD